MKILGIAANLVCDIWCEEQILKQMGYYQIFIYSKSHISNANFMNSQHTILYIVIFRTRFCTPSGEKWGCSNYKYYLCKTNKVQGKERKKKNI